MSERNHEVVRNIALLGRDGKIIEEGWARRPVWRYEKKAIKANKWQIKEWDYYAVTSRDGLWTLCGTISDLGYASLLSVAFIDFKKQAFSQKDAMKFFTFGKMGMAPTSTQDNRVHFENKDIFLDFEKKGNKRILHISAMKMVLPDGRKGLDANIELTQTDTLQSMNIATSWAEKRTAFYLNEKVNCMPASGTVKFGDDTVQLKENDAWGVLDWGRGRWTYQNTWSWGSGNGFVDGHSFGFNIGYGFTDRTPASENVIFYDGVIHKLDDVEFHIPESGFTDKWKFTSSDGRFEMEFEPVVDRHTCTNFAIIKSDQHQVFGYFTGNAVLDDGKIVHIEKFPAFAEKVFNRY